MNFKWDDFLTNCTVTNNGRQVDINEAKGFA